MKGVFIKKQLIPFLLVLFAFSSFFYSYAAIYCSKCEKCCDEAQYCSEGPDGTVYLHQYVCHCSGYDTRYYDSCCSTNRKYVCRRVCYEWIHDLTCSLHCYYETRCVGCWRAGPYCFTRCDPRWEDSLNPSVCGPPRARPACQVNSTYDLSVYVKNAEGGCGSLGGAEGDALVTIYNDNSGNLGSEIFSGTTDSEGKVFLDDTSTSNSTLYFQASKTVGGETPITYYLNCPTPSIYKTTLNPAACDEKSVILGIVPIDKASWKTVIDGDIFASQIGIDVPEGSGLGGFSLYLINSNEGSGGYALTKDVITTSHDSLVEAEGGYAEELNSGGMSHSDVGLEGFTFLPPSHDEVNEISSIGSFEDGSVYKISVEDFNNSLSSGPVTYSLSSGLAVLYITGSDDVVFENSLTASSSGRLIIVTSSDVVISKEVGFSSLLGYTINSTPNIEASILTNKDITIESEDASPSTDIPVMLLGPLISKRSIFFNRDLGISNSSYPSVSVKHDQTLMCKLSELEKSKTDFNNYTGLRSFDVQFDYGD